MFYDTDTLHRIDPEAVKKEMPGHRGRHCAGFVFDGESNVLRSPVDDHTKVFFQPIMAGHNDQCA